MASSLAVRQPPSFLGAATQLHSAQNDRLTLGAVFIPAGAGQPLAVAGGALIGPEGTMGEVTLVSDTQVRVNPARFVVPGTIDSKQGQYEAINDAQNVLPVTGKDSSLFRRSYLAMVVADSQAAGVASSPTTDGAWLQVIDGALAASNPALPTAASLPANTLLLGEFYIPSVASGQAVQWTPYNPRTGLRGAILPVIPDTATTAGHGGAPGVFLGQHRDHPTRGLERWSGTKWVPESVLDAPIVRLTRSQGFSITNALFAPINWDLEDFDTHGMHDGNSTDVFCRRDGYYRITFGYGLQGAWNGRYTGRVDRNNTPGSIRMGLLRPAGGATDAGVQMSGLVRLNEGDKITPYAFQDTGAARPTAMTDFSSTFFEMHWLRPL